MIYALKLPTLTRCRLTDIVLLQMSLLYHAARTPNVSQQTCARYLNAHPRFHTNSAEIAKWLWERNAGRKYLKDFAAYHTEEAREREAEQRNKIAWCVRLRKEVKALLSLDDLPIKICPFDETHVCVEQTSPATVPPWIADAKDFLLYFYNAILGNIKEKFPHTLFSDPYAQDFGREEMLTAFLQENKTQEICATCDEGRYYTHGKKILTDLDHYLPKSLYPHFACHPYNLVPSCTHCNFIKSNIDPLAHVQKDRRHKLSKALFPYHDFNLSRLTYLEVNLASPAKLISIGKIRRRPDQTDPQMQYAIEDAVRLQRELYGIPDRWRNQDQEMRIGDTLFRRMRQFLGDGKGVILGSDISAEVYNTLKQLLYYLDHEDQQKDPFAFAMTWALGALIQQQHSDPYLKAALVEEINSWFGQSLEESEKRDSYVEALLKIIEDHQEQTGAPPA